MDLTALYSMSYGVYIVTSWDNGRPVGCTANCAAQITATPATVMVSINKDNYTNKCIFDCGYFALSVLSEKSNPEIIGRFGFNSSKNFDKFADTPYEIKNALPIISDACAYIVCKVINTMDSPTHTVFLGEVIGCENLSKNPPMTYAYYHKELKGKTAKNAPTYQPEQVEKDKYACSVCGYVYDGETPFENLPNDWKCPVCKQPKSAFKKA